MIENPTSQINPYENKEIKIILKNNENIKFKKFEFIFLFHEFNSNPNNKDNKMNQKNFINIYMIDKKEDKNIEKNYSNRYFKFKEELNRINTNIKSLIKKEKNFVKNKKIKLREIFILMINSFKKLFFEVYWIHNIYKSAFSATTYKYISTSPYFS